MNTGYNDFVYNDIWDVLICLDGFDFLIIKIINIEYIDPLRLLLTY